MTRQARDFQKLPMMFLAVGVIAGGAPAMPEPRLVQTELIVLKIKTLNASRLDPGSTPLELLVDPQRGGSVEFSVAWPGHDDRTSVKLNATESAASGDLRRIKIDAELTLPDGTRVTAERRLEIREATTAIFELFRLKDQPLTLALDAEFVTRTAYSGMPTAGRPVTLNLAIQRIERGNVIPLETNRMNTLVGEAVTYRFRLGPGTEAPSVRLTMTPIRITGDIVELDVDLSGTLPLDVPELISRHDQVMATRATATAFGLESGDPPTGYRFVVTPIF